MITSSVPALRVGVARCEVDVPAGTPMAGYAARASASTGVHDQLLVSALVVDHVAIVTVDCCALHEDTCSEIGSLVSELIDDVVVTATHTHSGPCIAPGRLGPLAPAVLADVVRAAVDAVGTAVASARGCSADFGEVGGLGIAADRRHLDRKIDPPLHAVRFTDNSGQVVAHLVSFPCHPVVLDATNTLISADYPHRLRADVEQGCPGSICVFATGVAGDINTGHSAEASYTTQGSRARTFSEADRIGTALASAVRSMAFQPITIAAPARLSTVPVRLPFAPVDPAAVAVDVADWTRELETADAGRSALLQSWIDWAGERITPEPAAWSGRVGLIRLGGLAVITLPGEPFSAVAEAIRAGRTGPTIVLGYCDGVPGYFPTRDAYPEGGYEVVDAHRYYGMPAPFAAGSAEQLVAAADTLLSS